ncbi:transcriptional regulator [Acinetobacter beijerinckii]|uniref:IclR family transcriptional regulator n=1 Tax=Acinetobacter beijerinckii TaxID=262668 RepID=UPI0023DE1930|nr:IclR family transcriptional regulator C-terminal domain-containing protein [Acinetobacter beijerinckii]MDF2418227.1 transcriptional regulator [Acinetobacter beijerinckii]
MAISSFGKILTVLDLFSVSRPIINVDIICDELSLSKPTAYRYLKELVSTDILKRISGTSGDYTLGSKIAVLDYISHSTDPLVQISIPFMRDIVERTELCCLLTYLNHDYCIDLHHETYKEAELLSFGRGCPRPVFIGASPKIVISHLSKQQFQAYYHQFTKELAQVGFAQNLDEFTQKMRKIKKQGFYLSEGEIDPMVCGLSVPIRFSNKEAPIALTLVASKNRFDFLNVQKLIEILQSNAAQIEHKFTTLIENQSN